MVPWDEVPLELALCCWQGQFLVVSVLTSLPPWSQPLAPAPCPSPVTFQIIVSCFSMPLTKTEQKYFITFYSLVELRWLSEFWQASKLLEKVLAVQPKSGEGKGAVKRNCYETAVFGSSKLAQLNSPTNHTDSRSLFLVLVINSRTMGSLFGKIQK